MKKIATLTMNPTIDVSYEADRVFHTHKIRSHGERYDPGGGGINVARVIARLGGIARAHYLAGGATGAALDSLLDLHQMVRSRIDIAGHTRISTAVYERESGKEFRFVPRGPTLAQNEWQGCLDHLDQIEGDFLVASGSLPEGAPEDFYSQVAAIVRRRGMQLVLDSSGPALKRGLESGGIFLVKPSLGELQQVMGQSLVTQDEIAGAASKIIDHGWAQYVAVTMGHRGAILAHQSGTLYLPAVPIEARSAVGAGDSFVAAMVYALALEWDPVQAFRYGIAAGAAAVQTPGTDLCHRSEVERIFKLVADA